MSFGPARILVASTSLALFSGALWAQQAPSAASFKTGADQRYEILGIPSGMSCDAAGIRLAREARKGLRPSLKRTFSAGPAGARKSMEGSVISEFISTAGPLDKVDVSCTGAATGSAVFRIDRIWEFGDKAPTIDQLKQQYETKFGPFTSTFNNAAGYRTFGMLANDQGRIQGPDDACGAFTRNTPEAAVAQVADNPDPKRCAFAFTLSFDRAGPNNEARKVRMILFDYMAYANALEFEESVQAARRKQASPVLPKP